MKLDDIPHSGRSEQLSELFSAAACLGLAGGSVVVALVVANKFGSFDPGISGMVGGAAGVVLFQAGMAAEDAIEKNATRLAKIICRSRPA